MTITELGTMGGLFAILTLIHFFVDWGLQTHSEAMIKHNHPWVRARHCAIYTASFLPLLLWCRMTWLPLLISANILFWSHFAQDTYVSIYYWMLYIRRPPCMTEPTRTERGTFVPADPKAGFLQFIDTTLGKILMIVIDQVIHLLFLLPVAYMLLKH